MMSQNIFENMIMKISFINVSYILLHVSFITRSFIKNTIKEGSKLFWRKSSMSFKIHRRKIMRSIDSIKAFSIRQCNICQNLDY